MANAKFDDLRSCLNHFQTTFNHNSNVRKLINNWNRSIVVEATDTGAVLLMDVKDLSMADVQPATGDEREEQTVYLQATEETLIRIFSGECNPANAFLDGDLAVFSSEKDKVKLEAITMVVWNI